MVVGAVVGHGRAKRAVGDIPVWPHVADAKVIRAHLGAGRRVDALAVYLGLGVSRVVALPDHQVLVARAVVGHGRAVSAVVRVPIWPHVADADGRAEERAGGRVHSLAPDLVLVVHQGNEAVVTLPHHQVLVVGAVIGHRRVVGIAQLVFAHEAEAHVVVARLGAGRVQPLAEGLVLVVHQWGGVVFAVPDHQVFVVRAVVGHGWTVRPVGRAPIRSHVADAKVVGTHAAAGRSQ